MYDGFTYNSITWCIYIDIHILMYGHTKIRNIHRKQENKMEEEGTGVEGGGVILKGLKRKNERGYRLKANHFSSWSRPMKVLSDVPVSRNWYKAVLNNTKIHMCKIDKILNLNHVTRTITNGRAVYWSRVSACITWTLYCTSIGGISGQAIRTYK